MAKRPVFVASNSANNLIEEIEIEFTWFPGFSINQKQRSINSLHDNFKKTNENISILEVSSKSPELIGTKLSAFHLMLTNKKTNLTTSVETIFQSSKVFENGGPYIDLVAKTPNEAKKDPRLKNSGKLLFFDHDGEKFALHPKTLFYDWLYINALNQHKHYATQVLNYDAFTDIEFNQQKSINCQARSASIFVALSRKGLLKKALNSLDEFKQLVYKEIEHTNNTQQLTLDF